jgi:hypothetical protein
LSLSLVLTFNFSILKVLNFFIATSLSLALSSNVAYSQTFSKKTFPAIVAHGFINFSAASRNQVSVFEKKNLPDGFTQNYLNNSRAIGNDSQLFLKATTIAESGVKYGAMAKVEFNINSDSRNENPNLDQAFFYSENNFGKFEIGNNQAVNQKMKVGPARFARGAGGINGKYLEQINLPMLGNSGSVCSGGVGDSACSNVKLPRFILLAQSPIGHGGYAKSFYRRGADNSYQPSSRDYSDFNRSHFRALKDDSFDGVEDATKLSYYTPRIAGLQLGASYAPDSNDNGFTANTARDVDLIRIKNIFSFGANYSQDFDNLGIALSATAEKGQIKNSKSTLGTERQSLLAYDAGLTLTYFGFNLGGSYGTWGNSLQPKNGVYSCDYNSGQNLSAQNCDSDAKKFSHPSYYTTGISYQFGPVAASITELKSEFQKNKYQATSLGLDYKLTRDLMPYFEVTKFTFKSNQPTAANLTNQGDIASSQRQLKDNHGYVLLTGILYFF